MFVPGGGGGGGQRLSQRKFSELRSGKENFLGVLGVRGHAPLENF